MGGFGVLGLWATLVLTLVGAIALALGFLWLSKRTLGENVDPTHNASCQTGLVIQTPDGEVYSEPAIRSG